MHNALPSRAMAPLGAASLLVLSACMTVGPDYAPPSPVVPATWRQSGEPGLIDRAAPADRWWRVFGDPVLAALVERGLRQNLDLRASLARLAAARAQRGVAAAGRWPTLDLGASYEHRRESENTPFGAFIPSTDIHTASFDAAWELDLWGRVRRSVEAATAELGVSEADVHAAAVTVAAEVARTYVDLLAARRRLVIAQQNLTLQQQTLDLVRARLAAGLVGERDVAQAETNVETTRSRLPELESLAAANENRLAVLLGQAPGDLAPELPASDALPSVPTRVAVGAPADLLRRRPDVRRAERRLAAEVARIGAVEAERYPQFTLSGTLGLSADGARHWFDRDSEVIGFGPSVRWNLFDGGRLKNRVRALEAEAEAVQLDYEQTVLTAIEEAETAMISFVREQARRQTLERAAERARRAVDLARTQYREGLTDFQAVLDSERIVARIEDDLAVSAAAVATNLIALYKALGGGFVPSTADPSAADPSADPTGDAPAP
ncbi:MAG: efflux transporter outer membrane subunit [Planctomycetota bacterium]